VFHAVTHKMKNDEAHQLLQGGLVKVRDNVVCCSLLQYVAVGCSRLHCVAVCCSDAQNEERSGAPGTSRGPCKCGRPYCVLQCVAVCCCALQCNAMCGVVLPCVAVCCSVLQCVVVMYKMKNNEAHQQLQGALIKMGGHVVCCSVLQCVAVCCSVLQSVAVSGNDVQNAEQ